MIVFRIFILTGFLICFFFNMNVFGGSILHTKHNLSLTGPGPIKSTIEEEICIFCHTPHNARRDIPYLWNRFDSTANYIPYQSSTLHATVGQPAGASKLCLSCHDGTVALGALISEFLEVPFAGGIRFIPEGPSKLATDLSDDHPVSFLYNINLAISSGELLDPSSLPPEVKLDSSGQMQCTACHDPHDDTNGKFLVKPNNYSGLCTICHQKNGWSLSSHSTSNAAWNGAGSDPWPHTPYDTVSENGCENCHKPHTAGGRAQLLNYLFEEDNCLVCHNGNAANKNIAPELTKFNKHAVQDYTGIHNPVENFQSGNVPKHVECTDCHNPHQTNANPSPGAPQISGALTGVVGINASGQQISTAANQYEICFKCHADNNVINMEPVSRQIQELNTRLEFALANPSYHPVETQGVNTNVPSLLPPYTVSSIIFCTDCHNNDDVTGPKGPHGSNNDFLLERNYTTLDNTQESSDAYALCYKCHDRSSILGNQSFTKHNEHITGIFPTPTTCLTSCPTPCSTCHDAHGISSTQGTPTNNAHLINFDITIVHDSQGGLRFEDLGTFSGRCFLTCHGAEHNPEEY